MDTRAFRKTFTITLPACGQEVKVRKPDLLKMALRAKNGQMPSALRQQVFNALNGRITTKEEVLEAVKRGDFDLTDKNASEYLSYWDMLVTEMLVEPRIAEKPDYDNGEISIDDLDTLDKQHIAKFAQSPEETQVLNDLLSFRDEQGGVMELASDVQAVRTAPVNGFGAHG